ncbi:mechanosensitive ion channel protein MscL [Tyzzerella sp. An114]|uniref:large conductance mechanosensitive channel protein MscL n=1 Tax=Tyzzerella sp. An114 TaxID=1965545 RepID=UPI000B44892E|nr:large conductance mechanosensitive channel protein MscL [Tyzzerella sp. An114]OUQ58449.1 mechanosensitive ion channel protein MscL [Tyzzerella sp. An114]
MEKIKTTLAEFKKFAFKGNVVDMAVGVIIGGAFSKIVTSLVNDIIMPIVGIFTGGADFSGLFYAVDGNKYATIAEAEAVTDTINYGLFISQVLDFLIMAAVIFVALKIITRFKKKQEEAPKITTKECPYCKTNIHIDATRCPNCTSEL